jgi:hypothetical protein
VNTREQTNGLSELEEWLPGTGTSLPQEFSLPPLPDPREQERFLRGLEERAVAAKTLVGILQAACGVAWQNRRENGGTNRLYIYANRWGVRCEERTPTLRQLEGVVEIENPDFVKRGW